MKAVKHKRFLNYITTYSWCDSHSTSISACRIWGINVGVQVSRKEFHTYIHVDYVRVEFLFYIKKKILKLCHGKFK